MKRSLASVGGFLAGSVPTALILFYTLFSNFTFSADTTHDPLNDLFILFGMIFVVLPIVVVGIIIILGVSLLAGLISSKLAVNLAEQ